jgi:TolA-binding protein
MRNKIGFAVMTALITVSLTAPVLAQGRGRGPAAGAGRRGAGVCMGAGFGRGAGNGAGGWWNRVTPTTPEQQAFVNQVADLHKQIRDLNIEVAGMRTSNAPAAEIAKREQRIAELRAELSRLTAANEKLIRDMGIPAPYGVCNGQGRGGRLGGNPGPGAGWSGFRGNGLGLRNGTGPNPNCPLKQK